MANFRQIRFINLVSEVLVNLQNIAGDTFFEQVKMAGSSISARNIHLRFIHIKFDYCVCNGCKKTVVTQRQLERECQFRSLIF